MRLLYERYWSIAGEFDKAEKDLTTENFKKRWHPRKLGKLDEEYQLADRVVEIIDQFLKDTAEKIKAGQVETPEEDEAMKKEILEEFKHDARNPLPRYSDGFQHQANLILR